MTYRLFTLSPSGAVTFEDMPKAPTLAQLQKVVGGYIQPIGYFSKLSHAGKLYTRGKAYADEDGMSKDLPQNLVAGAAWSEVYPQATDLLGPVAFVAKLPKLATVGGEG